MSFEGSERRPQCPVCTGLGDVTPATTWSRPGGGSPDADRRLNLLAGGVVLGIVGALLFVTNSDAHHQCQTALGAFAGDACQGIAWRYYGGLAGLIVGVVMFVLGLRHRR